MVPGAAGLALEPRLCPSCEEWFDAPSFAAPDAECVACENGGHAPARERLARRAVLLARWPPVGDLPAPGLAPPSRAD